MSILRSRRYPSFTWTSAEQRKRRRRWAGALLALVATGLGYYLGRTSLVTEERAAPAQPAVAQAPRTPLQGPAARSAVAGAAAQTQTASLAPAPQPEPAQQPAAASAPSGRAQQAMEEPSPDPAGAPALKLTAAQKRFLIDQLMGRQSAASGSATGAGASSGTNEQPTVLNPGAAEKGQAPAVKSAKTEDAATGAQQTRKSKRHRSRPRIPEADAREAAPARPIRQQQWAERDYRGLRAWMLNQP